MVTSKTYDLCIVGGGIAGSLIAALATRHGLKTIVVEAGRSFDFASRSEQLRRNEILGTPIWPWENEARDKYVDTSRSALGFDYRLNRCRVKGVGGSTLHWGGLAQRLSESDFRTNSLFESGMDWPISYEDIERFYSSAEREIGVSGIINPTDPPRSQPFPMEGFEFGFHDQIWLNVAEKLGIAVNHVPMAINSRSYKGRSRCLAYSKCSICISGARYSGDFHMKEALSSGLCELLTETVARRIEVSPDNSARAIHATSLVGTDYEIEAKNFVIAAHAIEGARLLLLSNIGNESDQLGRNLMEHWYVYGEGWTSQRRFPGRIGFHTMESSEFYDRDREKRGAVKLQFGISNNPLQDFDLQNLRGEQFARHDYETFGRRVRIFAEIEHQPNALSRVTLDESVVDAFGDPAPHVHFDVTPFDLQTRDEALDIISTLLKAADANSIRLDDRLGPACHHIGTCRMSDTSDLGVVDKNCRVHGIGNVFIAGSAVFPTSGAKQPTLTIAALALRLVDYLVNGRT